MAAQTKYPISDHYDGEKFFNPVPVDAKSLWAVLKWKMFNRPRSWPKKLENKAQPQLRAAEAKDEVVVTFVNHATYLLQFENTNVLLDPVFGKRASPFSFIGPARVRPPGVAIEKLPPIHVVLVSHNHYDHMDLDSLEFIFKKDRPLFIVPLGNKKILEERNIENILELDWWGTHKLSEVQVTLVPAQHWSARGLFDRFESLWGGFVIEKFGKKIFFAGDTGYGPHFAEIRKRLGAPSISIVPVGAYEPRWFMKDVHMNPEDAVKSHIDLQATLSLGCHFGTFQLTDDGIDEPIADLEKAKKAAGIENFEVLETGETRAIKL